MYAFALGGEVGIDVQVGAFTDRRARSLAGRILGPTAARRLASLPASQRTPRASCRLWTRHEARGEVPGTGLPYPRRRPGDPG